MKPLRVLIVDDSAVARQTLAEVPSSVPESDIMATAADPFLAAERIRDEVPDVVVLDVEMPRMDGITFLRKITEQRPIPVVICSSLAEGGAETTLRALEYGAVEIVAKPKLGTREFLRESREVLYEAVRGGAHTIAQDEATSVVFGMPGEAVKLGAARDVLPLTSLAPAILGACQ